MIRNDAMAARRQRGTLKSAAIAVLALACGHAAAQTPAPSASCFETAPIESRPTAPTPNPASDLARWDPPKRPADQTAATRTLRGLNTCTLELYREAHAAVVEQTDTLVVVRDSGASLFLDGQLVETKRILHGSYFDLRYASHVPLAIYVTLSHLPEGRIDPELTRRLTVYAAKIRDAKPTIDAVAFTPEQKARQHRLLDASLAFLDKVVQAAQLESEALLTYSRSVAVDLERNIRDAGRGQVDGLHAAILDWRKNRLTDAQWCDMRFVVRVRQQARYGYGGVQYLAGLMRDSGDGRGYLGESEHVIVREVSSDDVDPPWDPDFDLLATIDLDAQASEAIFGDRDRLTVDVAADGARDRVRELDFSELNRAVCYP